MFIGAERHCHGVVMMLIIAPFTAIKRDYATVFKLPNLHPPLEWREGKVKLTD